MKMKLLTAICVSLAVIAAAVAAILVSMNRADEARAYKEAEAATEAAAEAQKRTAAKNAEAEAEKRRAAEQDAKAKADELAAAKLAKETAEIEAKTAAETRKIKEAEAVTAKANSETAAANREAEKAKEKTAREEKEKAAKLAEAEAAKQQTAAMKLETEKLKGEKVIAEAKLLELRQLDLQEVERNLAEWKRDLEEREMAIKPEKTIADLSWVGGDEDMEVGSNGTVRVKHKAPYLVENDLTLPRETRRLAKVQRMMDEEATALAGNVRESIVKSLERLYVEAIREDRVIDAEFYRKSLKSLYPDWVYKGEEKKEEKK